MYFQVYIYKLLKNRVIVKKKNLIAAILVCGCVGQAFASEQVVTDCESGMLSVLLSPQDAKVTTKLTVSGEMDARDFRYLQDSFPVLDKLDIENVKISAYEGVKGTLLCTDLKTGEREDCSFNRLYPENELPEYCFQYPDKERQTAFTVILPKSIKSIGQRAFSWVTPLEVIIPDDIVVDSLGLGVFEYTDLDTIILPASVTAFEGQLFWQCRQLEYADLSKTQITFLPPLTFGDCKSLKKVLLPATLDSIAHQAFQIVGEWNLDTIVMCSPVPPKCASAPYSSFLGIDFVDKELVLEVPEGTLQAYADAGYGQWFTVKETENGTTTSIPVVEFVPDEVIVYPNPVEDILYIKSNEGLTKGFLMDNLGRKIGFISTLQSSINMADLPAGVYFLLLETENGVKKQKIFKK